MLRCPFHEDNTASLQVNPAENKYKCHACDKKGDVIQFVQDYEKLTNREALKKCTAPAGSSIRKHWASASILLVSTNTSRQNKSR